jgi:hypothetical protein
LADGRTKLLKKKENADMKAADIIKGYISLLKLIPLFKMAIISVLYAILEVKNMTEINVNRELKSTAK